MMQEAAEPKSDGRWVWIVAVAVMCLTLVPYLLGAGMAHGRQFMWLGDNLIDSTVYLAQMRQAADGKVFGIDLFTTEPQRGTLINPLFLALGNISRFTGLPLITVYHAARLGFGLGLLLAVWNFIRDTIANDAARKFAYLFVCFGAGFAWLPFWWNSHDMSVPIDHWMTEALTFLSLHLSPLFCASLLLQVVIFHLLLKADRSGRINLAIGAGVCGFLLTMIHPYNIVSEAIVWGVYLAVNLIAPLGRMQPASRERLILARNGVIAGLITLPALLYMAWQLKNNAIFQQTRPNEPSVSIIYVLLGFGIPLLLAIGGAILAFRPNAKEADDDPRRPIPAPRCGQPAGMRPGFWHCGLFSMSPARTCPSRFSGA